MMLIVDSVIPARDQTTLLILLGFGAGAFALMAALESLRRLLAAKAAIWTEGKLTAAVFEERQHNTQIDSAALGHVRQISAFLRNGVSTLFDAPISLLAFFVLWLIHPIFLAIATVTMVTVLVMSFWGAMEARTGSAAANTQRKSAMALADALGDAGPGSSAMGTSHNVEKKFLQEFSASLVRDARGAAAGEWRAAIARGARQFAQICALAVGAVMVMNGELTGGAMIAATIIMGKALAPFDQLSGAWHAFIAASKSAETLNEILEGSSSPRALEKIAPERIRPVLHVDNVTVPRGLGAKPILDRIDFTLHPGECLAVVGPSGSGKTTLAEIIAGVAQPPLGAVSIDGIPYGQISEPQKNSLIGLAPQSVQFFPGSITENISRFRPDAKKEDVLDAVERSNTEWLIRDLPEGFDTVIDAKGRPLSLGNARRVALARAIFGRPKLVVLDEPTSDLDEAGEKAIISLIGKLKSEGAAIVLIAQRAGLLAVADKLMQLENGRLRDFGAKNEVLMRLSMRRPQIDLTPALDETPRLLHWVGVHLSRVDDGPIRARAEIALVEIFNLLREREDVNEHEKISVVINLAPGEISFDVFCGASEKLFDKYEAGLSPERAAGRDLSELNVQELGTLVALQAAEGLTEEFENDRLRISFSISGGKPANVDEDLKVAV